MSFFEGFERRGIHLTLHALDRFIDRVVPHLHRGTALVEFWSRWDHAVDTKTKTENGQPVWFLPGTPPGCAVLRRPRETNRSREWIVVTCGGWDSLEEEAQCITQVIDDHEHGKPPPRP